MALASPGNLRHSSRLSPTAENRVHHVRDTVLPEVARGFVQAVSAAGLGGVRQLPYPGAAPAGQAKLGASRVQLPSALKLGRGSLVRGASGRENPSLCLAVPRPERFFPTRCKAHEPLDMPSRPRSDSPFNSLGCLRSQTILGFV